MNSTILKAKFARIGARVKQSNDVFGGRGWASDGLVSLDVRADRIGEYFEVIDSGASPTEMEVLDVRPDDRHLLLMVRENGQKHKFLCGHDERHWFVAAIRESAPVGTVEAAKESLKPRAVKHAQITARLSTAAKKRRKNAAYQRQGEWFFIPAPAAAVDEKLILKNEPISRGNGSKPHLCEFLYRTGGETVYVSERRPQGIREAELRRLIAKHPDESRWQWEIMRRNAQVLVRGRIRHADHKTITLVGWHEVVMNTENESAAMRNVAFLD